MEWCVCKYKHNGRLFVMSRQSREKMLAKLTVLEMDIPSVVVKTFCSEDEALIFVSHQLIGDFIITEALEE